MTESLQQLARPVNQRRTNQRRTGYVLIAVLGAIVLIVTVLTSLSHLSLRRGLAAADAQRRLQQRIGSLSIEKAVLDRAGTIFDDLEEAIEQKRPFPNTLRTAITFGGVTYDVLLADEDTKVNLNSIYHAVGVAKCQASIARVVGPAVAGSLRLIPATPPLGFDDQATRETDADESDGVDARPRAFRSWGEVFDLDRLATLVGDDAALPVVTPQLTCWGGGAVNLRRASDAALESAASCVLSAAGAKRLISRYRENPTMGLTLLIRNEATTEEDRNRLRTMLTETSTHFSVWIDASTKGRRSQRTFSVSQQLDDGTRRNERFAY